MGFARCRASHPPRSRAREPQWLAGRDYGSPLRWGMGSLRNLCLFWKPLDFVEAKLVLRVIVYAFQPF